MNGCFVGMVIARASDRVPLCSFTDAAYASPSSTLRQQEQRILERFQLPTNPTSGEACGTHYRSFDHKDVLFYLLFDAATNLTFITAVSKLLMRGGEQQTQRLACQVLDAVFADFTSAYTVEQTSVRTLRPFQFIQFDKTLQKTIARIVQADKRSAAANTTSSSGGGLRHQVGGEDGNKNNNNPYQSLKNELNDVHVVIRQNLEDLLTRGERLETMNTYSTQLKDQSSKYYKRTVQLNRMRLLKMYGPPAVVIVLLLCFIWWYFF